MSGNMAAGDCVAEQSATGPCSVADVTKEICMRKVSGIAGLAVIWLLAVCTAGAAPSSAKSSAGTIVIVFKDGHRQTFKLSDIERVEFPGPAHVAEEAAPSNPQAPQAPPRG